MDVCTGELPMTRLSLELEFEELPFSATHETIGLVSLECPEIESEERKTRAPLDLCCVLDKSGSMAGKKLELVKAAMEFVVEQLKPQDRVSLVTFDTTVEKVIQLQEMNADGKQATVDKVKGITDGSCTNLSGGLFAGLEVLKGRTDARDVSCVLLFTDGLANEGIKDTQGIVNGVTQILQDMPACSIFCFGFGDDHSTPMLTAIAESAHGLYYYIQNEDKIPTAFGECIGGLLSVAAQNVRIEVSVPDQGEYQILESLSAYKTVPSQPGRSVEVQVGDMYSGEKKDLLFRFAIPAVPNPVDVETVASVRLHYFNACTSQLVTDPKVFNVRRVTPEQGVKSSPSARIGKQRNRLLCVAALKKARELGDQGKLEEGRQVIGEAVEAIKKSPTADDPFCVALVGDLERVGTTLQDRGRYLHGGHQRMTNMAMCHEQQRCSENAWDEELPQFAQQAYTTISKMDHRSKAHK